MNFRSLLILLILISACEINAQKNNKTIIPRDSITGQYAYNGKVTEIDGDQDALKQRLDKWIAQNYNFETDDHSALTVDEDEDTYSIHGREQMEGSARRFIEYDLTVDMKDSRYRYKLTDLRYIVVGNYALEDKRATDKKKDLEEIHRMMYNLLKSLQAAMTDTW